MEESTICFYEDPNVLKLVMDISSDGHKGPLIPLVSESKQVYSVISYTDTSKLVIDLICVYWFSYRNRYKTVRVYISGVAP